MTKESYTNRLIHEKSPYLIRCSHQPVNWFPWGKEAFEVAKREDKPIFLSIGYATCHWCHVMERESFDNPNVAKILNEVFVNIKVDREELPEIDSLYMELAQALMSSAGGWPLNVIMTPDLKPFFAITYLPPTTQKNLVGLDHFAEQIQMLWKSEERKIIIEEADKIVALYGESVRIKGERLPTEKDVEKATHELYEIIDPLFGGLKGDIKFPVSYINDFLLSYFKVKGDNRALFLAQLSLDKMSCGGIYDQLGGGFSRYSIDRMWHVPHFEKMLIDNALLASSYLEAWKLTQKEQFLEIAKETLNYLLRTFYTPKGGFFSSEDADINGTEGLYYTWEMSQILEFLPEEDAMLFCHYYGVTASGNFHGRSILHVNHELEQFADALQIPQDKIKSSLERSKRSVLQIRDGRPKPLIDDKIVAASNGFAIDTFARAALSLNEPLYWDAALKSLQFIFENFWKDKKLTRRYRDKEVKFAAGLDDYSAMIKAALTLYEGGAEIEFLLFALEMEERLRLDFKAPDGAFYQTDPNQEILIRKCEFYDGAEPSGNGVHAENLLRLYQMSSNHLYLQQAEDIFKASFEFLTEFPAGSGYQLLALERYLDPKAATIVIALNEKEALKEEIVQTLFAPYLPHLAIVWKKSGDDLIDKLMIAHKDKKAIDGKTTIYISTKEGPLAIVHTIEELKQILVKIG